MNFHSKRFYWHFDSAEIKGNGNLLRLCGLSILENEKSNILFHCLCLKEFVRYCNSLGTTTKKSLAFECSICHYNTKSLDINYVIARNAFLWHDRDQVFHSQLLSDREKDLWETITNEAKLILPRLKLLFRKVNASCCIAKGR